MIGEKLQPMVMNWAIILCFIPVSAEARKRMGNAENDMSKYSLTANDR